MSHFTVLVIGNDVEAQLAPFHEFECTGVNDPYVQEVDQTEEVRNAYQTETQRMVRLDEGLVSVYDDRFYRRPTAEERERIGLVAGTGGGGGLSWCSRDWGLGYETRVHDITGYEEVEVLYSDSMTFREFCAYWTERPILLSSERPDIEGAHKWGWIEVDTEGEVLRVVRRTNPNARWDWYLIGGRWTGFFKLKPGCVGITGEPGLMTDRAERGYADQARKGDIDFEGMRLEAEAEAGLRFDEVHAILAAHPPIEPWAVVRDRIEATVDPGTEYWKVDVAARKAYNNQPALKALWEAEQYQGLMSVEEYQGSREDYLRRAGDAAVRTFAVVKDGQWYERGRMGWWGAVHDEQNEAEWNAQYRKLLAGLPDDTWLTVVDCHI